MDVKPMMMMMMSETRIVVNRRNLILESVLNNI